MSSSVPCAPSNITRLPCRHRPVQMQARRRRRAAAAASRPSRRSASTSSHFMSVLPTRRLRAATFSRTALASGPSVDCIGEVADADAAAADLVFVGRADAARRRADLAIAAAGFGQHVELAVIRQDQVRLVADEQAAGRRRCPSPASSSISANSACGSTTTPLPMRQITPGAGCPTESDGGRTSGRRRRPCARRCGRPDSAPRIENCGVSRSTILPLPSSPHWAPSTHRFMRVE